jgi:phosphoribosylformylglycinamidine (FGAM) synthase-like amidotransferase family enzyme
LSFASYFGIFLNQGGAVAQSGERLTGSQKVVGSNPISSTNFIFDRGGFGFGDYILRKMMESFSAKQIDQRKGETG